MGALGIGVSDLRVDSVSDVLVQAGGFDVTLSLAQAGSIAGTGGTRMATTSLELK
jgi:hypothetical protein